MTVTFYELRDGAKRELFTLGIRGGRVEVVGGSEREAGKLKLLEGTFRDPMNGGPIDASAGERFLEVLPGIFHGSYLWAESA